MAKKVQGKKRFPKWMPAACVAAVVVVVGGLLAAGQRKPVPKQQEKETPTPRETYDPLEYVELGNYVGVEVSLAVTKEDVKEEIKSRREDQAIYEQEQGTVQEGDMVYADFEGRVDGLVVDSTCGSDYVDIGSGEWLEGFEAALVGANTGDQVRFTLPVPEGTYEDDEVDGRDVEFAVTIHYICGEEIIPEYNDDFVQSVSKKYKTTKEYNKYIRRFLRKENEEQKAEFAWSEVMEDSKVKKYPKQLLQDARREVLQGYYDMAAVYGCSREEVFVSFGYESEEDFIESELDSLAKDTAKEYLLAQAVAAKENISFTQEEFDALKEDEYYYVKESYESADAFASEKKEYLENLALLAAVKNWISERADFTE